MNPYAYPPADYNFRLKQIASKGNYELFEVTFRPAFSDAAIGGSTARGEFYRPKQEAPAPLAIIAHGMGNTSLIPPRWLALSLVKKGWAVYLPYLTVHSDRTPKIRNPLSISSDEWLTIYHTSVVEMRQALEWAAKRKEIDKRRMVIIGISFGGFVAAITMALEPDIKAGILIESGGNATKINYLSPVMRRHYGHIPISYEKVQEEFQAFLARVAERGLEESSLANPHFLTDPLTFAFMLHGRPLLMINGYFDALIPRAAALEMARAAQAQHIRWLPAGHLSLWLWYPLISRMMRAFLREALPQ